MLAGSLTAVRTPVGASWILTDDEERVDASPPAAAPSARLLPSGDSYFLLWGADRRLLVPDPGRRDELWPSRVWPGAVLVDGKVAGTWRRAGAVVTVRSWRRLSAAARHAIEEEARSLPVPGDQGRIGVQWAS